MFTSNDFIYRIINFTNLATILAKGVYINCNQVNFMLSVVRKVFFFVSQRARDSNVHYNDITWEYLRLDTGNPIFVQHLFRLTTKGSYMFSAFLVLCEWKRPVTGGFLSQRASNAEEVFLTSSYIEIERIACSSWNELVTSVILINTSATWHLLPWSRFYGPLARYVKLWVAHAAGMPGTFSPPPRVSDPDMQHGTCVTHVSWCMPGSLPSGFL